VSARASTPPPRPPHRGPVRQSTPVADFFGLTRIGMLGRLPLAKSADNFPGSPGQAARLWRPFVFLGHGQKSLRQARKAPLRWQSSWWQRAHRAQSYQACCGQAGPGSRGYRHPVPADGWRSCGAAYGARRDGQHPKTFTKSDMRRNIGVAAKRSFSLLMLLLSLPLRGLL
jgi:hypothetical protein